MQGQIYTIGKVDRADETYQISGYWFLEKWLELVECGEFNL